MSFFNKSLLKTILALLVSCFTYAGTGFAQATLITGDSAGSVRIGMTVGEAQRALRGFSFRRTSDGEGIALIQVLSRNREVMRLFAGEFDSRQPIDISSKIEFIEVTDSAYRTTAGVSPGMRMRDVESKYGSIMSIMVSEIESREFARFTNQPQGMDFRIRNFSGTAGIYPSGQTITTRYSPSAVIQSVIVLGGADDGNIGNTNPDDGETVIDPTANYSSQTTDLRTQCQTPRGQGNESGHISTYCQGFGGYQIHIFDTATTMEINAQTTDREKSVHVASQSLSFNRNNSKVEWRFRDGKPFAVMMRAAKYQLGDDGLIEYPERQLGEFYIVKGLPGYEHIDYEVNANLANADDRARKMADDGFDGDNSNNRVDATYQDVNINRYNRLIEIAARGRQAWVKSPTQVVINLIGEMKEVKSRNIRMINKSAEGGDSVTAVITDNGLLDDSVNSERLRLELRRNSAGVWEVISGKRAWKCQQGRGHQDFSAVACN